jgi:hypothetical protein
LWIRRMKAVREPIPTGSECIARISLFGAGNAADPS